MRFGFFFFISFFCLATSAVAEPTSMPDFFQHPLMTDEQNLVLPNLQSLDASAYPESVESYKPADRFHKNPLSRIGRTYFETLASMLKLNRIHQKEYWQRVWETSNTAVASTVGIIGDTANDIERARIYAKNSRQGFMENKDVRQCTAALPALYLQKVGGVSGLTQMKHTWLQIGDKSYGMPFTGQRTYFGGYGRIESPDPVVSSDLQAVSCVPTHQPQALSSETFTKNVQCIAEKASSSVAQKKMRVFYLDYHALKNNCLSAVRFILECAGGRVSQMPNLGIGGNPWKAPSGFLYRDTKYVSQHLGLFSVIAALDRALGEDLQVQPKMTVKQFIRRHQSEFMKLDELIQDLGGGLEDSVVMSPQISESYKELYYHIAVIIEEASKKGQLFRSTSPSEACGIFRQECGL